MDEKRIKAYVNLINQLLNCQEGKKPEIINANHELYQFPKLGLQTNRIW